jgi:hypothetical protein
MVAILAAIFNMVAKTHKKSECKWMNGQTSAFYLVLISIVDCIVVLVALKTTKNL